MLARGWDVEIESAKGFVRIHLDEPACLVAEATTGAIKQKLAGNIEYDTCQGNEEQNEPRPHTMSLTPRRHHPLYCQTTSLANSGWQLASLEPASPLKRGMHRLSQKRSARTEQV